MQDRRAPYLPPDWEPPPADTDEDVARSNRCVALIVLSFFLVGIAASAIAFALSR